MAGAVGETVAVSGLRELSLAFAKAGRETNKELRTGMKEVAEPVRLAAERLTVSEIRNMGEGAAWSKMRTGVTRTSVYVAPVKRGLKGSPTDPRRRPNLATLILDRAFEPALARNEAEIVRGIERLMDKVADNFNR